MMKEILYQMKIVNWEDDDSDGLADEGEYLSKTVTETNEIKVLYSVVAYIQNLQRPQDDDKINAICNDIQNAYNQWMSYLWGLNWSEGFKTTDTGENLGAMEQMISNIGGNDLVPDCSGIDINNVVKPYDVDHPATNETYEGIIVQSAGKIDTSSTSPQRGKIIITAIGYSFSSPIPKDDYEGIIEPRLSLVCPRPNDPEYPDHYINVLDIDTINNSLKLAGSKYRITPMKRGIRGEFEVKYESPSDLKIQELKEGYTNEETTTTYEDYVSFSDYLVASNDNVNFGYDEEIHGPIRVNGNINFSGEIWDTITAKNYVRDYITFGPYANKHTGGFHFYIDGVEYKVEPFKNSSQNSPSYTTANIYPPLDMIVTMTV